MLMTADTVGGVWPYALDLARALGRFGVEVHLAAMGGLLSDDQQRHAAAVPNLTVFESAYKLEWMIEPWADVAAAGQWLLELERRVRPDIIHVNGYAHAALPWNAPVLAVGHSCVLSWWSAVKNEPAPAAWDRYRQEVARGLAAAALVVSPTHAMLAALRQNYPGAIQSARVIPNGRDPALFRPDFKTAFVLAAGRLWDDAKNIRALEAAAERLRWPVYVAGDERHPAGGEAQFERLRFLGRLPAEDLARQYGRASIYALPARYEPFGLSVLEAALAGCALVLGDIPSLRENWDGAAVFVPPGDIAAIAAAINGLISDPSRRSRLRARSRERALRFAPEAMAEAYFAAYTELASARPSPKETRLCAS